MLCNMYRGFTKFARVDYVKWKEENRLVNDGVTAKVRI
jgi:large subunit ribosomal protein L10e